MQVPLSRVAASIERGVEALYPALDEVTALREYQQTFPFLPPCTICSYTVALENLVDLRLLSHGDPWDDLWHSWQEDWRHLKFDLHIEPPTWVLGDLVLGAGHTGIIFPSMANPGGVNVVVFNEQIRGDSKVEVNDPDGKIT